MTNAYVVALGRSTFDLCAAQHEVEHAMRVLDQVGVEAIGDGSIVCTDQELDEVTKRASSVGSDLLVVLQATFTDASAVIALGESCDAPLLVWSFPEPRTGGVLRLNSLCGANLAAFSLRRRGRRAEFLHADPQRCDTAPRLLQRLAELRADRDEETPPDWPDAGPISEERALHAQRLARSIHGLRIGVIGERPIGFEPCDADDDEVERSFGVRVERVPLQQLFDEADRATPDDLSASMNWFDAVVPPDPALDSGAVRCAARLASGLDTIAETHDWNAIATRCWPECITEYGAAVCTAQSMLTAKATPAVCEADTLGALTALVLRRATGSDPFVADLVDFDTADDTSVLWHCGCASPTLADPACTVRGIDHPNRHVPLANEFALQPGRVTVARISRLSDGLALVIAGGTMLSRPRPFSGTCGVLHWDLDVDDVIATIFDEGVEHHLAVVYGDHRDTLVALAAELELPVVRLGHPRG